MTNDMTKTITSVNSNEAEDADKESQKMERNPVKIDEEVVMKKLSSVGTKAVERLMGQVMSGISGDEMPKKAETKTYVWVRSNSEVVEFERRYKSLIWDACTKAGMGRPTEKSVTEGDLDREEVLTELEIRYATDTLGYDPSKGIKESSYIYTLAMNTARTLYRRQNTKKRVDMPDEEMENHGSSCRDYHRYGREDAQFVFREALNRLAQEKKCGRDQLEVLVRYILVVFDDKAYRAKLAQEYGYQNADSVSVIATRWLPRLISHARNVVLEDLEGRLEICENYSRISFLKPYLEWL